MASSSLRLFEYLESQPGVFFEKLYEQPSTALAVFRRMLPHLAKTLVMSMLYLCRPLPVPQLESWVRSDYRGDRDKALSVLERLKILETVGRPRGYALAKRFAKSLRLALTGGGNHKSFGVPCHTPQKDRVTVSYLDEFARQQWEALLSYMVGSAGGSVLREAQGISESVKKLLLEGRLVNIRGRNTTITQEGFTFVLEEVNAQVWEILVVYLSLSEEMKMNPDDMLSFIFQLGSLELGQDYSKESLSPTQTLMLEDLNDLGLIYQSSSGSSRFYPTRLATTLTSDASALRHSAIGGGLSSKTAGAGDAPDAAPSESSGFIVLETNYRLYAYTTSELQIAILTLFSRLTARYPNLVAGKLTRQSVRNAVAMGITADQIVGFLTAHAHQQMRNKNNPVLPPSVVDQIRLWQIEGERMQPTHGYLFRDFANQAEYDDVVAYARDLGVLRWKHDVKRMCFLTEVQQMGAFIKSRQKKADK